MSTQPEQQFAAPEVSRDVAKWATDKLDVVFAEVSNYAHIQEGHLLPVIGAVAVQKPMLEEAGPGSGKTNFMNVLAATIYDSKTGKGVSVGEIEGNADMTPSDIVGVRMLDRTTGQFQLKESPLMNQVVKVDEISRASVRAQAAFMKALVSHSITPNGSTETYQLPKAQIVMAAQNATDPEQGTNPLTQALLDRFFVSIQPQPYGDRDYNAIAKIRERTGEIDNPESLVDYMVTPDELVYLANVIRGFRLTPDATQHTREIIYALRDSGDVNGAESNLNFQRPIDAVHALAKVAALLDGAYKVGRGHVDLAAAHTLRHRVVLSDNAIYDAKLKPEDVIADAIASTPKQFVPRKVAN